MIDYYLTTFAQKLIKGEQGFRLFFLDATLQRIKGDVVNEEEVQMLKELSYVDSF